MLTEDDYDNFSEVFDDTDYEDDELDSFLEFNGEEEELQSTINFLEKIPKSFLMNL
jgi:hypothetical protein